MYTNVLRHGNTRVLSSLYSYFPWHNFIYRCLISISLYMLIHVKSLEMCNKSHNLLFLPPILETSMEVTQGPPIKKRQ